MKSDNLVSMHKVVPILCKIFTQLMEKGLLSKPKDDPKKEVSKSLEKQKQLVAWLREQRGAYLSQLFDIMASAPDYNLQVISTKPYLS